ncbi:MAG: efflux RND transporter periplasmic adaptor subunit, partial [Syntrophomonadaceae bacterium]|nr:efflux RND transporter periplasmic adaptor subunit [Syntrophomonadaceae bacterium]
LAGARAALDNARTNLANSSVPSPIAGTVGLVSVSVGDAVGAQTQVAVVSDTSRLQVQVNAAEADVSSIRPGSAVKVYVPAVSERPFAGIVETVAQAADPRARTYPVKVVLDNPGGELRSGMFAEVHLTTASRAGVLALPLEAVGEKGARKIVYVVDDKSVAHEREVTLGLQGETLVEVLSGLKAGERVVVKGQTLIRDGDRVRVVAGGMKE